MIPWFESPRIALGSVGLEVADGLAVAGAMAAEGLAHPGA